MNLKESTSRQERVMLINKWRNRKSFSREKAIPANNGNLKRSRKNSDRECFAPLSSDQPPPCNISGGNSTAKMKKTENRRKGKENNNESDNQYLITEVVSKNDSCETQEGSEKSDDSYMNTNLEYAEGDLVWAFISGYPLWPSLITADPEEGVYTKQKSLGKSVNRVFHVEFFGDNGSRSWLTSKFLFLFGKGTAEELQTENESFIKHVRTKSKIFLSLQRAIKGAGRSNWAVAVTEAQKCLDLPRSSRVKFLKSLVLEKLDQAQRKRKTQSLEANERKTKRQRQSKEVGLAEEAVSEDDQISTGSSEKTDEIVDDDHIETALKEKEELKRKKKGMKTEVCESCGTKDGRLYSCSKCKLVYHSECGTDQGKDSDSILCTNCQPDVEVSCFLCKQTNGEFFKCSMKHCGRNFHRSCLDNFHSPSAKQDRPPSQFICPAHYCHTCVVQLNNIYHPDKKLLHCIKCPTAYHSNEMCLGAGSIQLSASQIICPKHEDHVSKKKNPNHCNASWCLLCSQGGSLICCERCPASFHMRCLSLEKEPEGSYICIECIDGKTILYGDIVWVKIGVYRWWPARVIPLEDIPVQFQSRQTSVGEFLVRFFGSHDYAFVHRGQVFNYHEGDQGSKDSSKKTLAVRFKTALAEASAAFQQRQLAVAQYISERESRINVKPPPYMRIRSNKAVGKARIFDSSINSSRCECSENQENPCGPDSECLNRMLLIECESVCPAGAKCENQFFQKRMYPPLYTFNTGGKGWGLKADTDLKKGDFVIEYVGEVIDHGEFLTRLKAKQDAKDESYYFLTLDNNRVIDAGPRGNLARFMNHSCQPNCETQKWTVLGDTRVGLFALTDIPANTELTFNYQLQCAQDVANESNQRQQPCHCGAPNCAGFIGAKSKSKVEDKLTKSMKIKKIKKKKNRKVQEKTQTEDFCFRCAEGGHLMMCDVKTCSKVYHLACLNLEAPPRGQWTCPWHHCDVCGRKTATFCSICPNSFCSTHAAEANLQTYPKLGLVCNEHSPEDLLFFVKRLEEDEENTQTETGTCS